MGAFSLRAFYSSLWSGFARVHERKCALFLCIEDGLLQQQGRKSEDGYVENSEQRAYYHLFDWVLINLLYVLSWRQVNGWKAFH